MENKKKILIVIDVQNDFVTGSLGTPEAQAVVEPDGRMVVVTRDMFGIAMKATFGEVNGQPIMIYKDPKTDVSHLKKSHKGCCHVYYDENGELRCRDGYDSFVYDGALKTVFKDGEMCYVETFKKIRNRLNGGN